MARRLRRAQSEQTWRAAWIAFAACLGVCLPVLAIGLVVGLTADNDPGQDEWDSRRAVRDQNQYQQPRSGVGQIEVDWQRPITAEEMQEFREWQAATHHERYLAAKERKVNEHLWEEHGEPMPPPSDEQLAYWQSLHGATDEDRPRAMNEFVER